MHPLRPWPVVRFGDTGHPVKTLQWLLRAHGSVIDVDGEFGPQTRGAVEHLQNTANLVVDGICGPQTWPRTILVCQYGDSGDQVKGVQEEINYRNLSGLPETLLALDGQYGPKTREAVEGFQKSIQVDHAGMVVDGICGPYTWRAFVSNMLAM